jgi:hypothetical protein
MSGFDARKFVRSSKRKVRGDGHHHGHATRPEIIVIEAKIACFQPRSLERFAQELVEAM